MFEKTESMQEQIKRSRQEQILAAAGRVFAAQGYHSAKMRDVAKEAGVSNGTVYNYYASKEELLQALLHRLNETEQRAAQFSMAGVEGDAPSFRAMSGALFAHRLGFVGEHAEIFRALLPELLSHSTLRENYLEEVLAPSLASAESWLSKLMDVGELEQRDPALTTRVLASQALGLLVLRLLGDPVVIAQWESLPALVTEVLCDGVLPDEA